MNYYGISIVFSDDSNLFYNPISQRLEILPEGTYMPSNYFFKRVNVNKHKEIVERLAQDFCGEHSVKKFRLHEIRPNDRHYEQIHRESNL